MNIKKRRIKIRGEWWRIWLVPDKLYEEWHDDVSWAQTSPDSYRVDFKVSKFNLRTARHELWHMYNTAFYIGSTNHIKHEDLEEMQAEMLENYMPMLEVHAGLIHERLSDEV